MATRPSNSKWERKKAASQASAWAGAISFFVLLALWLNAASAATVTVLVGNSGFNFSPSSVTIHPGDTVRWNFSSSGHSTTSGNPGMPNGIWDSGIRGQGAIFSRTFNTVGTFPYFCTPHGQCCGMTGTVSVTAGTPTPTPTPLLQHQRPVGIHQPTSIATANLITCFTTRARARRPCGI